MQLSKLFLCIVLCLKRFPKLTGVVDIADLGLDIVGARAEDSSQPLSDAFSKVVLLSANCIRGADGILLIADRDFVGINCKQVSANKITPGHVIVVIELKMLRILEEVAHCCDGYTRV